MARIFPELSEDQLRRIPKSEARFYRACREQLDGDTVVFYSVAWVLPDRSGIPSDGEADFVIFHPGSGYVVVEVKGGGISYDAIHGEWYSVGGSGPHRIKDPFRQAMAEKHSVLALLREHPAWQRLNRRIPAGHAVFVPDVDDPTPLSSAQRPLGILGGRRDLSRLADWVKGVMQFWNGAGAGLRPLGRDGMAIVERVLCDSAEVRPLISIQIRDEEERRIWLTSQQARVLRMIGLDRRRAAICGGAGTGKTLIAIQKARELASAGNKTLLLCYNRPLSDYMKDAMAGVPNLETMTFHQLCDWRARVVRSRHGRDLVAEAQRDFPGENHFDVHLPVALELSLDILDQRYDAIIVDEGQDFGDEYWLPLETLLQDSEASYLYVFYDQNQSLYRKPKYLPVKEKAFPLTVNCRNTKHIHDLAYQYFKGDDTDPCEIEGTPVELLEAPTTSQQCRLIVDRVRHLLGKQGVPATEICVLVAGYPVQAYYDLLRQHPLPTGVCWSFENHGVKSSVLVDTVARFKGLEASVVFLWGIDDLDTEKDRETVYVGTSRAKSRLYLVGHSSACRQVLTAAAAASTT